MALTQLEMVLRGEPNLSIRFRSMASPNIKRRACLGKTEKHSLMMTGGKQLGGPRLGGRHQNVHGMTKSEDFFLKKKLQILHPRGGNYCVCDGECTHTPCRTHIFLALFPCVTYRHEHTWLKVFAVRLSYLSISPSPFSCFIHRPCCCRTVTSTRRSRLHLPCRTVPDPKARVKRTSARAARSLATWPIPRTSQKVRQASTQRLVIALQSEMSQESTASVLLAKPR